MDTKDLPKIKLKRRFFLLVTILIIICIFSYHFFKVKSYIKEYTKDNILITESYNKDQKSYLYRFNYLNEDYVIAIKKDYSWKRKLVNKIDIIENEQETCLLVKSNELVFYPLCRNEEEQISYLLTSDEMKTNFNLSKNNESNEENKFNDITIYNYGYHNYYIWNYKGFDHLNENESEIIELDNKDIYDPKLIIKTSDYLFVPDYHSDYYFNKVYLINALTGKTNTWDLGKTIYFDSIVLGVINNDIYLLDKHENIEWKINVLKKKIEKVGTKNKNGIFYNNEWQKLSLNKIIEENSFKGLNSITYTSDNGLKANIMNQQIKLKNDNVKIIDYDGNTVYYLINDILYEYSLVNGEEKLLSKFEWNFNNQNTIYIF